MMHPQAPQHECANELSLPPVATCLLNDGLNHAGKPQVVEVALLLLLLLLRSFGNNTLSPHKVAQSPCTLRACQCKDVANTHVRCEKVGATWSPVISVEWRRTSLAKLLNDSGRRFAHALRDRWADGIELQANIFDMIFQQCTREDSENYKQRKTSFTSTGPKSTDNASPSKSDPEMCKMPHAEYWQRCSCPATDRRSGCRLDVQPPAPADERDMQQHHGIAPRHERWHATSMSIGNMVGG
eukprot:4916963-Amphidinium_carterae.1